jgi:hypothetical protein
MARSAKTLTFPVCLTGRSRNLSDTIIAIEASLISIKGIAMKPNRLVTFVLSIALFGWTQFAIAEKVIPKRIYINAVELPKHPDVVGSGAIAAALLGGALAASAADGAGGDIEDAYAKLLAKNNIDVGLDIAFELTDQLSAKGYEVVGTAEQADATMRVIVENYGLAAVSVNGSKGSIPMFQPVFILTNRDGKKLWRQQVLWGLVKDVKQSVQPHPVPDYFHDPKVLTKEMRIFNTVIISTALSKL